MNYPISADDVRDLIRKELLNTLKIELVEIDVVGTTRSEYVLVLEFPDYQVKKTVLLGQGSTGGYTALSPSRRVQSIKDI